MQAQANLKQMEAQTILLSAALWGINNKHLIVSDKISEKSYAFLK